MESRNFLHDAVTGTFSSSPKVAAECTRPTAAAAAIGQKLRVLAYLAGTRKFLGSSRRDAQHIHIVRVDVWDQTGIHGIEIIILVFLIESGPRGGIPAGRSPPHAHFLFPKLQLALPQSQLSFSQGQVSSRLRVGRTRRDVGITVRVPGRRPSFTSVIIDN